MTQNHKTVILEKQARQSLLMGLLKDHSTITDTNFVSLNVFLNTLIKDERNEDWFKCVAFLEKEAQHFDVLKTILGFPITSETLLEFINLMADEGWTVDQLPSRNKKEEELKKVIHLILSQEGFDRRVRQWESASKLDMSHIEMTENFYTYPISKRIQSWEKLGLKLNEFSNKTPKIKAFYTNNPRSEAQACVQMILEDEMVYEDQVIVCMDPNLESQVESILLHHKVPYFRVNEHKTNAAFRLIQDLINLKLDSSNKNLIRLIQNDLVDTQDRLGLMEYLRTFRFDVSEVLNPLTHVKTVLESTQINEILGNRSLMQFENLEKKAERGLKGIRPQLKQLVELNPSDYALFIEGLFNLYVSFFKKFNEEEVESINKIKQTLESAHPYLKTMKDPYPSLLFALSKLTLSNKQSGGVILTDLKHAFIPNKKRVFILSCTQEFYPQNPVNVGLFDDEYRLSIVNDVRERYNYHKLTLDKLKNSFEEVIYSYPLGGYDGKKKEFPNELSIYFGSNGSEGIAKRWRLVENDKISKPKRIKLSTQIADELFFKNNELYGSVSTLEYFFHCPYRYFLNSGIGLNGEDNFSITNATIGTIYHYVLEKGIEQYGKNYAKECLLNVDCFVDPIIEDLKHLYPKQSSEIEHMKDRTKTQMKLSLEFLISREAATSFTPYAVEKEFSFPIDLGMTKKLHLKGYIDRIDLLPRDGFIIIDYKSSVKTLVDAEVMAGLKLQLPTYMWICDEYLNLGKPYGMYYFSFGQESTDMYEFKYKIGKPDLNKDFNPEENWFDGRRLNGWTTTEIYMIPNGKKRSEDPTDVTKIDSSATHIVGNRIIKDGSYSIGNHFDAEKIYIQLRKLYASMIDDLLNGRIEKTNVCGACNFCPYSHFCQYKGQAEKPSSINNTDSILRAFKGETS